jgi:formate hydrogenlyase subunit 3/multisubunit Na+/H+ antiporter MnhD subunit
LAFNSRAVPVVQGLAVSMKGHALVWLVGIVFICAMPPSVLFFSELALVFSAPVWVSVVVLLLLFIVFAAMMKTALSMVMGRPLVKCERLPARLALVPSVLLVAIILLGIVSVYFVAR